MLAGSMGHWTGRSNSGVELPLGDQSAPFVHSFGCSVPEPLPPLDTLTRAMVSGSFFVHCFSGFPYSLKINLRNLMLGLVVWSPAWAEGQ